MQHDTPYHTNSRKGNCMHQMPLDIFIEI